MAGFDGKDVPRDEDADQVLTGDVVEDEEAPFRLMSDVATEVAGEGKLETPLDWIAFLRRYFKEKSDTMVEMDELTAEGIPVRTEGLFDFKVNDYEITAIVTGLQALTVFGGGRLAEEAGALLIRVADETKGREPNEEERAQLDAAYERIAARKQKEMMFGFLTQGLGLSEEEANKAIEEEQTGDGSAFTLVGDESWGDESAEEPQQ